MFTISSTNFIFVFVKDWAFNFTSPHSLPRGESNNVRKFLARCPTFPTHGLCGIRRITLRDSFLLPGETFTIMMRHEMVVEVIRLWYGPLEKNEVGNDISITVNNNQAF